MSSRPLLIIFAKAPVMGGAKSRLAAGIGKVHAARIYRAMTAKILRCVQDPRWDTVIAATPDRLAEHTFGGAWPAALARQRQGTGTLSHRLARAFEVKRPIIVIGTDAPQVRASDIAKGFKAVRRAPAVFGPADDGGFWLIGLSGPVKAQVFNNVAWSTDTALADMQRNLGADCAYLRTLIDVDDVEALRAVRSGLRRC